MTDRVARYPYQAAVDAYGNGGFRFAEMSHKGSILCLPSGVYAWDVRRGEDLVLDDFAFVLAELKSPTVLLLGTGARQIFMNEDVTK
ncbi:MAG: MTH938/NDUFAF3 family protein, partial [Hyphomicrobium sp.]